MTTPLAKLTKVLELERSQGFDDRAVIGGIETFARTWQLEATGVVAPDLLERVAAGLESYGDLDASDRARRVDGVLATASEGSARLAAAPQPASTQQRIPASTQQPAPARQPTNSPQSLRDDPELSRPLVHVRGLGLKSAEQLERLGLGSIRDLLFHAPTRYEDFRVLQVIGALQPGALTTVIGTVSGVAARPLPGGRSMLSVGLTDTTGEVTLRFFNQPYLEKQFSRGRQLAVSGEVQQWSGRLYFNGPNWEPMDREQMQTARMVPVYPLTDGVSQRWLRNQIQRVVDRYAAQLGDAVPAELLGAEGLLALPDAVRALHAPGEPRDVDAARRRLAVDELLVTQLWSRRKGRGRLKQAGVDLSAGRGQLGAFTAGLPFTLTSAQDRVLGEVVADLCRAHPMSRLVQGDVGSGKTAVAAGAVAVCVAAGRQAAVMAPTEILAEQHMATFAKLLAPLGFGTFKPGSDAVNGPTIARLVGSMRPADKAAVRAALASGDVDVVIGTHAVIQDAVDIPRLGLSVVDEQHRFGVLQRAELRASSRDGALPHQLVMTATPIPRTLALVLNADLDHSVVDELPPGRTPVKTVWFTTAERERGYQYIRHRVTAGERAFIVFPLVEASDAVDAPAAEPEYVRLAAEVYPDLRVGLLHGRLPADEKESVMAAFRRGELDILVATSVIEVGVDVPEATVLLIEGADRFGLAQLHQLRGRIGRGEGAGACILLADDASEGATRRLDALTRTTDGLELAELDLQMRGPGDFFGLRQAGAWDAFAFARGASLDVMAQAGRIAGRIMDVDPDLGRPEHAALLERVVAYESAVQRS